jgi:hypothetical protein
MWSRVSVTSGTIRSVGATEMLGHVRAKEYYTLIVDIISFVKLFQKGFFNLWSFNYLPHFPTLK